MHVDRLVESREGVRSERICLATRPHWFLIARQGARALMLVACGFALLLFAQQLGRLLAALAPSFLVPASRSGTAAPVSLVSPGFQSILDEAFAWGGVALTSVGVLLLGWVVLNRHFTEYAITISPGSRGFGGRIIKVQGVLYHQTVTVPLSMVNDLVLYEPLLGRILGWGHIDIETGNDYTGDRLEYVPDPRGFQTVWKTLLDNGYGAQEPDHPHGRSSLAADPYIDSGTRDGMTSSSARPDARRSGLRARRRR